MTKPAFPSAGVRTSLDPALIFASACIILVVALVWRAALGAAEPPVWDSMSYFQKAQGFWDALKQGRIFNPFNIVPTTRPPGTVLVSYPFGFSADYHGFLFRTVAIPLTLLFCAGLIAGYCTDNTDKAPNHWFKAAFALHIAGLPLLYHFQLTENIVTVDTWGRVDGFLTSLAALATACTIKAASSRSIRWSIAAALIACIAFTVKPSGLIVMALIGLTWLILLLEQNDWRLNKLAQPQVMWRYALPSFFFAITIYATTVWVAYGSEYFSEENMAYGRQAIKMMSTELPNQLPLSVYLQMVQASTGFLIPLMIVGGIIASVSALFRPALAIMCIVCLGAGFWFMSYTNGTTEIRYLTPFIVMGLLVTYPVIAHFVARLREVQQNIFAALLFAPLAGTTVLLVLNEPPQDLQAVLGINLTTTEFVPERNQIETLLQTNLATQTQPQKVYFTETTSPFRMMIAAIEYVGAIEKDRPRIATAGPIDWQKPHGIDFADILSSNYIVFAPIKDDAQRQSILAKPLFGSFEEETRAITAWMTGIGEPEGVHIVSDASLRILKIVDYLKLELALENFRSQHTWTDAFLQRNKPRLVSLNDLGKQLEQFGAVKFGGAFSDASTSRVDIYGIKSNSEKSPFEIDIWLNANIAEQWTLFAHLVDDEGAVIKNTQTDLISSSTSSSTPLIRRYTLSYQYLPEAATKVALGFFHQNNIGSLTFLSTTATPNDWDGRRLLVPIQAPKN